MSQFAEFDLRHFAIWPKIGVVIVTSTFSNIDRAFCQVFRVKASSMMPWLTSVLPMWEIKGRIPNDLKIFSIGRSFVGLRQSLS